MSVYDVVSDIRVLYLTEEMNNLKRFVRELNKKVEYLEYKINEDCDKKEDKEDYKKENKEDYKKEDKEDKKDKKWFITSSIVLSAISIWWFYKK